MSSSMEQQMRNIFDEEMQIKRVMKQIGSFNSNQQNKTLIDHHITYIRKELLFFHISLRIKFLKKHDLPFSEPVNFRVVYPRDYPYSLPQLYFSSASINDVYTQVGKDYFKLCCPGWSPKHTILDIIFAFPSFFKRVLEPCTALHTLGMYYRGTYVELESLYLQKSCEFYPIQIAYPKGTPPAPYIKNPNLNSNIEQAFLIVNTFDLLFLEHCSLNNYGRIVEAIPLGGVTKIYRCRRQPKKLLIMIKKGSSNEQLVVQVIADDTNSIIESILTKKQTAPVMITESAQMSSQNQEPATFSNSQSKKIPPSPEASLEQINEQIVICESMLQKSYDESNVNSLIMLYKKAIELCSASNNDHYKMYLNKMQDLLSNQTVQVIMSSTMPVKPPTTQEVFDFDFFNDQKTAPTETTSSTKSQAVQQPKSSASSNIDLLDL